MNQYILNTTILPDTYDVAFVLAENLSFYLGNVSLENAKTQQERNGFIKNDSTSLFRITEFPTINGKEVFLLITHDIAPMTLDTSFFHPINLLPPIIIFCLLLMFFHWMKENYITPLESLFTYMHTNEGFPKELHKYKQPEVDFLAREIYLMARELNANELEIKL